MKNEQNIAIKVGKILKNLRLKNNLTQLEISLQCDVSTRHYQEIEYGRKNCQINTLTKILKIYSINLFSFFTSFLIDEFRENGAEGLYEIFGDKAFGLRAFDLNGTVTHSCAFSETITGMKNEDVIGKVKIWSDLTDQGMIKFIKLSMKSFLHLIPNPPAWKVQIKNHATNTSGPFLGFMRYKKNKSNKVNGVEIILFPLDTL